MSFLNHFGSKYQNEITIFANILFFSNNLKQAKTIIKNQI